MKARSLVIAAVAFGIAVAVVVALAVPTGTRGDEPPKPAASSKRIVVLPYVKRELQRGSATLVLAPGDKPRIERTIKDPEGGLPWAVRIFRAKRVAPVGEHPTLARAHMLG